MTNMHLITWRNRIKFLKVDGTWRTDDRIDTLMDEFLSTIESLCTAPPQPAPDAMREALRHADIDLSMLLPEIANEDMRSSVRNTLALIDVARQLSSPSGAGAAEPVAWPIGERGTRANPSSDVDPDRVFIAPPVRGDREAIAQIVSCAVSDGEWLGARLMKPAEINEARTRCITTRTNAILSFPSAPVLEPKP